MTNEELREALLSAPKNGYSKLTHEQRMEMEGYCRRYAAFMDVVWFNVCNLFIVYILKWYS